MKLIAILIIIALLISLVSALWPFALLIAVIFIAWKIYEFCYYKSSAFTEIRQRINTYINDCNELNQHIEELKNTELLSNRIDYGNASYNDSSKWNYQRKHLKKERYAPNVHNCSRTVCDNASKKPFEYICKYFGIKATEENLEHFETILNNWSIVKIGTSANQKRVFFNLNRAKRALGIMDGNLSDDQTKQIADYLNVPENDVKRMSTRLSARDVSLNSPAHSDDDARDVLSNMPDEKGSVEEDLEQLEFRRRGYDLLRKNLEKLPERDREILRARRLSDPVATLESLSQKYGISRERVRQIEERAYNKLRDAILKEAQES